MNELIFITNELMVPSYQATMHLPLTFINYAIYHGKMYHHYGRHSTFITPNNKLLNWNSGVVYGGLFLCKDFDFYARILDAYHVCSLSTLLINHDKDIHHRTKVITYPIYFDTLKSLSSLKYSEGEPIEAAIYLGNINHPKIKQRLKPSAFARITNGIDKDNFIKLYKEMSCC